MGQTMLKNCTICKRPAVEKFRPFCSARCADVDLGRWLNESYAIPGDNIVEETSKESQSDLEHEES